MKFSEWLQTGLLESPQFDDRELDVKEYPITRTSRSSVERESTIVFFDHVNIPHIPSIFRNQKMYITLSKTGYIADIGFYDESDSEYPFHLALRLTLRKPFNFSESNFPGKKCLQVAFVNGSDTFSQAGLSGILYAAIAAHLDCYLFSDMIQHPGGQGLWLKIAKNPLKLPVKVKIYNAAKNEFFKDGDGNDIIYDSKNVSNRKIWSDDETHKNILLMVYVD